MPYKKYKCQWCETEFKQFVWFSPGESDPFRGTKGKKSSISTQVQCPNCMNFIPTWSNRKFKK